MFWLVSPTRALHLPGSWEVLHLSLTPSPSSVNEWLVSSCSPPSSSSSSSSSSSYLLCSPFSSETECWVVGRLDTVEELVVVEMFCEVEPRVCCGPLDCLCSCSSFSNRLACDSCCLQQDSAAERVGGVQIHLPTVTYGIVASFPFSQGTFPDHLWGEAEVSRP